MPRWRSLMQHLGMDQSHIIKNRRSANAMARSSGFPVPDAAYHSAGQEHLISTQGMPAVLAAPARPHRKVAKDMRPKVLAILGSLILKSLEAFTFLFKLGAATDMGPMLAMAGRSTSPSPVASLIRSSFRHAGLRTRASTSPCWRCAQPSRGQTSTCL